MKIGIIGGGVVGHATARAFMEHAEVRVFDLIVERSTHEISDVLDCNIVFICLPTPQKDNSLECDTSSINHLFKWLATKSVSSSINFVLRSTVPIGTTRNLREKYGLSNIVHSPEFLTARCAVTDAQIPARNIVGYPAQSGRGLACITPLTQFLIETYESRFPGVPVLRMSSDESEAVKLGLNSFFAVKLAYFNELRAVCDKMGLNWDNVRAGILSDGRVAHSHTQVPGPDGKRGFGGTCLPKDLANLITTVWKNNVEGGAKVMIAALERNHFDRKEDRHGQDDLRG